MSDCCSVNTPVNANVDAAQTSVVDDCCAVPSSAAATAGTAQEIVNCPECGAKGKVVDTQVLKSMLARSLRVLEAESYRFCRTADCPVVYFSTDGRERYTEADLREAVHQKHPDDPNVFVCYCFRHTPGSIRAELQETGRSTVVEEINTGIKAGQCACEIRNPQASCCLGNVTAVVKRIQAESISVAAD